jgi:peroxiredoxin
MSIKTLTFGSVVLTMALGPASCKREETASPAADSAPVQDANPAADNPPADVPPVDVAGDGAKPGETPPVEKTDAPVADAGTKTDAAPAEAAPAGDPVAAAPGLPAALHTKVDQSCGRDPGVGTAAVPFSLKSPEGKDVSLASLRGKVVLLNFWGTWCKPCLKELPEFDRLVRHYKKHGAVLVAVATDTEPDKVLEFARSAKLAAKLALGGEDLAKKYDSPNFPFSFVIDDKGTIRGSYRGFRQECLGRLEQDLRTSLEQRKR